jgi:hypothetical protein
MHRAVGIKNNEKPSFYYLSQQRNKHQTTPGKASGIPLVQFTKVRSFHCASSYG